MKLVSTEEQVARIKAAIAARSDPDFLIVARTDAREAIGLDEAIKRGQAYAAAGADLIFVHWPRSNRELQEIASAINAPLIADYARCVGVGDRPILGVQDLHSLGFKVVIWSSTLLFTYMKAIREALMELREKGHLEVGLERLEKRDDYQQVVGAEEWKRLEEMYLPAAPRDF